MVRKVYREIISLRPPNLNRVGIQKPARLLQQSGLKEKWVRREISTFDYLIQLNTIAGRTYNDLNQYPIVSQLLILVSKTTIITSQLKINSSTILCNYEYCEKNHLCSASLHKS